jgi:coenzyme F420-0:L-glutamate ligase / coenzyme F420-1:gamma-L-glutamate ligase
MTLGIVAEPVAGLPEVEPGDDLAALVVATGAAIGSGDVVVVSQKVVSKAEGRLVRLPDVKPSPEAHRLAEELGKEPEMLQLVLDESEAVLRAERGVLITRTRHGLVCANAGVDRSNVPDDLACLLPVDPDASARRLRAALPERPAVVIADSFGRAWRLGQADVAIGCAGLAPLDDRRGRTDHDGRELTATIDAVADQAASAAALARDKAGREAIVVVRGLDRYVTEDDGPGAIAIVRPLAEDLFT